MVEPGDGCNKPLLVNPPEANQEMTHTIDNLSKILDGGDSEENREQLKKWLKESMKVEIAETSVCRGHQSPWQFFSDVLLNRPPLALVLGPRGGGKSYLSALETHLRSLTNPDHSTRVLGGSLAQSQQINQALRELSREHQEPVGRVLETGVRYHNGADVKVLAASPTSVRGPHVPSLKLDEVDEMDTDCREAAMGMCMNKKGISPSVLMTSTWHRIDGPMSNLMERARAGEFPIYTFCVFEVLEHCPEARSGPHLENCEDCPLKKWCHEDLDQAPGGLPKAKRSNGHYSIDSSIQKVRGVSQRTFEADYLCKGPKSEGLWFPAFDPVASVSDRAEYKPAWPVHLAIDSGVFTGAVFFQIVPQTSSKGTFEEVHIFEDYLCEGVPAEKIARELLELAQTRCNGRVDIASTDPAGGTRSPIGPTVLGEYDRGGLRGLQHWPSGASVLDGLALVESFIQPAEGESRLIIHPRCEATVRSLLNYRRNKQAGQWLDHPKDPQHPYEEIVDAIRGGLRIQYPEGRGSRPEHARISARRVF